MFTTTQRQPKALSSRKAGYTLPAVMLIAGVIAVWIGGLLQTTRSEVRQSGRTFHLQSSLYLAEAALELGFYAINHDDWSGWEADGSAMNLVPVEVDLDRGSVGILHAQVTGMHTGPRIIAEGVVLAPNQAPIRRKVVVNLTQRTVFNHAIAATDIRFRGRGTVVDSYDSAKGAYHEEDNRGDRAVVATPSFDGIDVGDAYIYGFVATGGGEPSIGRDGAVMGFDTPPDVRIDPSRISRDYKATFPAVSSPTLYHAALGTVSSDMTLPLPGHDALDGPIVYRADSIDLRGDRLNIEGYVVIHVLGDVGISRRDGFLTLQETADLSLYVDGNIEISGGGVINKTGIPSRLKIYGTSDSGRYRLGGDSDWSAVVYAPGADIDLRRGNGENVFHGSLVGASLTIEREFSIRYDEQLESFVPENAPNAISFRLEDWTEIDPDVILDPEDDPVPGNPGQGGNGGNPGQGPGDGVGPPGLAGGMNL